MEWSQTLLSGLITLIMSLISFYSGRKLEEAKVLKEKASMKKELAEKRKYESDSFLSWTKEFRDAKIETDEKLEETQHHYETAMLRIFELEKRVTEVVSCNNSLEKELDLVKTEKLVLQGRVTVLEDENRILKDEIALLKKKEGF